MADVVVVGLGPSGPEAVAAEVRAIVTDPARTVIVRTLRHPAAEALAAERPVTSCDDLYEEGTDVGAVYTAIAERVLAAVPVVYAVPGSPNVAEQSVVELRRLAADRGLAVETVPGRSFVDAAIDRLQLDPFAGGLQLLNGRSLPAHLILQLPTLISHVDGALALADVVAALGRTLPDDTEVVVLRDLGGASEAVETWLLRDLTGAPVDERTSLFVDPPPSGWTGLVATNALLRRECPWDRQQTHHSLVAHLVEEAHELADALLALSPEAPRGAVDYGAYAEVEEELGDMLLQVVFHATLAAEAAGFGVEEVAEVMRRKLVHRHPHVFGDVDAADPEAVIRNWEAIKSDEKGRDSLLDGVARTMPALLRAAKLQRRAASVGFDWPDVAGIVAKVAEEAGELAAAEGDRVADEFGDLLFVLVNLARRLDVDAELALRRASDRFERRFRAMEEQGPLQGLSLPELDELWEAAKEGE